VGHDDAVGAADGAALQVPGGQALGPAVAALDLDLDRGDAESPGEEEEGRAELEAGGHQRPAATRAGTPRKR
jgi:hypothetical protein